MHIITTITIFTASVLTIINNVTTACQRLSTTGEISCSAGSGNPSTSPPPSLVNSFTHYHCLGIFVLTFADFLAVSIGPRWLLLVWDISCWDKRVGIYLCVISQVGKSRRVYPNELCPKPWWSPRSWNNWWWEFVTHWWLADLIDVTLTIQETDEDDEYEDGEDDEDNGDGDVLC